MKKKGGVCDLAEKRCKPCEGGVSPLTEPESLDFLENIPDWKYDQGKITRIFRFPDFHRTMAFVNAVAWMAHQEDHHRIWKFPTIPARSVITPMPSVDFPKTILSARQKLTH